MRNIKLVIQYDGTRYAGWQIQAARACPARRRIVTLQETVEQTLHKILREKVRLTGCGRTDAGVHALAMVANFHASGEVDALRLKGALNGILPPDIAVSDVSQVPEHFHARFDAVSKIYEYLVVQKKGKYAFRFPGAWTVGYDLNVALMNREAQCLVGKRDFLSFQGSDRVVRKSVAIIKKIAVRKNRIDKLPFLRGSLAVVFEIEATGFLRSMVRNIVGTLVDIGRGRFKPGEMKEILKAKDRKRAGVCAPASGLYLTQVFYE